MQPYILVGIKETSLAVTVSNGTEVIAWESPPKYKQLPLKSHVPAFLAVPLNPYSRAVGSTVLL